MPDLENFSWNLPRVRWSLHHEMESVGLCSRLLDCSRGGCRRHLSDRWAAFGCPASSQTVEPLLAFASLPHLWVRTKHSGTPSVSRPSTHRLTNAGPSMNWLLRFLGSTIGLKVVMAVSGLALFGFVIGHLLGNLQVFLGAEAFNSYAETLQSSRALVWTARVGLLSLIFAHIGSAYKLVMRSRAARPVGYKSHKWLSGRYAVRTMRYGGVVLLAFIVYHLLHLTTGHLHAEHIPCIPAGGGKLDCNAFHNLTTGLRQPLVAFFYIVAQFALGLHLAHGVWSLARTLGLSTPRYDGVVRGGAWAFGGLITIGNCSIAVACLAGLV
ncbi:MAG: succinate dehydrogenase [Deltaproteobacteria bacterium]|nr:succinate dehydrogenase [Deltaproteobacteria bacterium]